MNYDDLPTSVRKQVDQALGSKPRRLSRAGLGGEGLPLSCHACGEPVGTSETRMKRHQEATGHNRYEWRP